MRTRDGQAKELSRPLPLPGKGVPGEEGGPVFGQGVEIEERAEPAADEMKE